MLSIRTHLQVAWQKKAHSLPLQLCQCATLLDIPCIRPHFPREVSKQALLHTLKTALIPHKSNSPLPLQYRREEDSAQGSPPQYACCPIFAVLVTWQKAQGGTAGQEIGLQQVRMIYLALLGLIVPTFLRVGVRRLRGPIPRNRATSVATTLAADARCISSAISNFIRRSRMDKYDRQLSIVFINL
jgi:hypothetical protein